jgi:hypothetical protein
LKKSQSKTHSQSPLQSTTVTNPEDEQEKTLRIDISNHQQTDLVSYMSNTNEGTAKVLLKIHKIQIMQEWRMLREIVSEKWKHFTFFGFEIKNMDSIKKLFAIAVFISSLYDINRLTSIF